MYLQRRFGLVDTSQADMGGAMLETQSIVGLEVFFFLGKRRKEADKMFDLCHLKDNATRAMQTI